MTGSHEVRGSIPLGSTTLFNRNISCCSIKLQFRSVRISKITFSLFTTLSGKNAMLMVQILARAGGISKQTQRIVESGLDKLIEAGF